MTESGSVSHTWCLHLLDQTCSFPDVLWADACVSLPVTRVPRGQQEGISTCLDYAWCSPSTVSLVQAHWNCLRSDHGLITFHINAYFSYKERPRKAWKPGCDTNTTDCFRLVGISAESPVEDVLSQVADVQRNLHDGLTYGGESNACHWN